MSISIDCDDPEAQAWVDALLRLPPSCTSDARLRLSRVGAYYQLTTLEHAALAQGSLGEVMEVAARWVGEQAVSGWAHGLALHAGCVARAGCGVIIAGASGRGKTTLTAWLLQHEFSYITDELTLVQSDRGSVLGWGRPLHVKNGAMAHASRWAPEAVPLRYPHGAFFPASSFGAVQSSPAVAQIMLFPRHDPCATPAVLALSPAQSAPRLWSAVANTASLAQRGFAQVTALARQVRAWELHYADVSQLGACIAMWQTMGQSQSASSGR